MKRALQYQAGSLQRASRKRESDVWEFVWRENDEQGQRRQRRLTIGSTQKYPTRADAERAIEPLRSQINREVPASPMLTIAGLVSHYRHEELSEDCPRKTYATKQAYLAYLDNWIVPEWGNHRLSEVKAIAVERWLAPLKRSKGTKAKIRNIMSALYTHALRHELWAGSNPIRLVRQSAKRERIPQPLEAEELQRLFVELEQRERTLILLDAPTGMRVGELLATKWRDVDFGKKVLRITRGIWHQHLGDLKTDESAKAVPLDDAMIANLMCWREMTPYNADDDWIFASPTMNGTQPLWPEGLMKHHIRPAAQRAGIMKHVSWQLFRHSFATMLVANGNDIKTVQGLLRHSSSRARLMFTRRPWTAGRGKHRPRSCGRFNRNFRSCDFL